MSQETTDNFWRALKDFRWPEIKPVFYRLYHDDQGRPLFYTMEDLPGTYIEVDQVTYISSPYNVKVQNGRLVVVPRQIAVMKLLPDPKQGTPCHIADICIIVSTDTEHQRWKQQKNEVY